MVLLTPFCPLEVSRHFPLAQCEATSELPSFPETRRKPLDCLTLYLADCIQGFTVRGHNSFLGRQVVLVVCLSFWICARESAEGRFGYILH